MATATALPTVLIPQAGGERPATDRHLVYCEQGHEAELHLTDEGPEVDGYAPDREDAPTRTEPGAVLWWCRHGHCDDSIILNTRRAS